MHPGVGAAKNPGRALGQPVPAAVPTSVEHPVAAAARQYLTEWSNSRILPKVALATGGQ